MDQHANLDERLERMDGCTEWTVRIYADSEALYELAMGDDPELHDLCAEIAAADPVRASLLRRKVKEQNGIALRNLEYGLAEEVAASLRNVAVDFTVDAVGQESETDPAEVELLRASLLIDSDSQDAFLTTADAVGGWYPFWRLEGSGPWPPPSFTAFEQASQNQTGG